MHFAQKKIAKFKRIKQNQTTQYKHIKQSKKPAQSKFIHSERHPAKRHTNSQPQTLTTPDQPR